MTKTKTAKQKRNRKRNRVNRVFTEYSRDNKDYGLLKIRTGDDPILKQRCMPVEPHQIIDPESGISVALKVMMRLLVKTKNGGGLAANQAGYDVRIIIVYAYGNFIKMINPKVIDHSDDKIISKEGCLSFPGESREVSRYKWVEMEWLDEDGLECSDMFAGIEATRCQHELDHIEGITIHEFTIKSLGVPAWLT